LLLCWATAIWVSSFPVCADFEPQDQRLGLTTTDYTAYNEMLSLFKNIAAIPVPLGEADQYHMSPDKIAEEIARGTSVILTSNPRNPTGQMGENYTNYFLRKS
jgi:aspartate/methionine/tyrosine aminotransferase